MSRARFVGVALLAAVGAGHARADAPPGHYTVLSAAEAKDNRTGLVWARVEEPGSFTWADARARCASKGSGYRVPTVRELQSLVDEATSPAFDTSVFADTTAGTAGYRWSSTPYALAPDRAWEVGFLTGDNGTLDVSTLVRVRCVR